jgi:hypothetical protein
MRQCCLSVLSFPFLFHTVGCNAIASTVYGGSRVSIVIGYELDVQHSVPSINRDLTLCSASRTTLTRGYCVLIPQR